MAVAALTRDGDLPRRQVAAPTAVRVWLWTLVALVLAMVAIGGATRLTGSGLSITEWKPVTGAVPPLTDGAWLAEFERYRASSQYLNLNRGMLLDEFKTIYWWEWSHRQLGRLIGFAFALPLLLFWWRGAIGHRLALALVGAGALGGLQALVGWIMVASGLEPGMVAVAPLKLMAHLTLAGAILALLAALADGLRAPAEAADASRGAAAPAAAGTAVAFLVLIFVQIALGGLVAGSRAGFTYNTWPLMDGRLVPPIGALFSVTPWLENLVDNPATVQFQHRLAAYLVLALALLQLVHLRRSRPGSAAAGRATVLAGLVLAQVGLGIVTLLLVVPLWAGLAHQLLAMLILIAATLHARRSLREARAVRSGRISRPAAPGPARRR